MPYSDYNMIKSLLLNLRTTLVGSILPNGHVSIQIFLPPPLKGRIKVYSDPKAYRDVQMGETTAKLEIPRDQIVQSVPGGSNVISVRKAPLDRVELKVEKDGSLVKKKAAA